MVNYWHKYDFIPGKIYSLGKNPNYYRFVRYELVMESFIMYTFIEISASGPVYLHEDRDVVLRDFELAPGAVQVLYGKEHT